MSVSNAILLGIIQGLTEFLPVSSSGHLVLGEALLGVDMQGIAFEVFVHFGTLLAVLYAFRSDIIKLFYAFLSLFRPISQDDEISEYRKLLLYIVCGTIPTAFVGFIFIDSIETAFSNPHLTSIMLLVTAVILFLTRFLHSENSTINFWRSIWIGIGQAIAIIPGISRSGTTIAFGLFAGIDREKAAKFSFLLAIPAIVAGTLIKTAELMTNTPPSYEIVALSIGTVTAAVSGYGAILLLLTVVRKSRLDVFALYCAIVGFIGLLLT